MNISPNALADFQRHVIAEYPREACGVLIDDDYVGCVNVDTTHMQFRIDGAELAQIEARRGTKVQAYLHSHPYDPRHPRKWPAEWPSAPDMERWLKGTTPWGIAACDGEGTSQVLWLDDTIIPPLKGRPFVHGVTDCYALIRDYFRLERGVILPNYARDMDWWESGRIDLYSKHFAEAGFVEISPKEVVPSDCCMFQVRSPVINHAAVITGPNTILHHMFHRASAEDQLSKWQRVVTKYVRYVGPT